MFEVLNKSNVNFLFLQQTYTGILIILIANLIRQKPAGF
jgi:hypothetical protein